MLKNCVLKTTMVDPCDPALGVLRQEVHTPRVPGRRRLHIETLSQNWKRERKDGGRGARKKREGEEGKKARMWMTPTRT